jgi:hypothetical protein
LALMPITFVYLRPELSISVSEVEWFAILTAGFRPVKAASSTPGAVAVSRNGRLDAVIPRFGE